MESQSGKCNSGMKSPMKMIKIVIVFVGMTTMACSDKPSSVSNDNYTTSALPASGILEKYPGHSPSGFIGDRRIRPGHYIQMDVLATTRNFINIWLPELCSYKGLEKPFFLLSPGEVNQLKLENTSTGGISLSGKAGEELEFTGTAEEFQYGLYLTVRYDNVSDRILEDVSSSVCIQLTAAPDFRDPDRKNTFWYNNGKWDNTFIEDSVVQEGIERCKFYNSELNEGTSLPLIVVDSQTGKHAIGLIFRDALDVGGNSQMSTGCMHSDGGSFDIRPGESAAREGILIIHPEGKEAVLKIAQEFYLTSDNLISQ